MKLGCGKLGSMQLNFSGKIADRAHCWINFLKSGKPVTNSCDRLRNKLKKIPNQIEKLETMKLKKLPTQIQEYQNSLPPHFSLLEGERFPETLEEADFNEEA